MANAQRGDIFWLKKDANVPKGKEFLLDHRLVILRQNNFNNESLVTTYEVFKIGTAYDEKTKRQKANKYYDEESQEMVFNDNPNTKMNEPIYAKDLNNLAHTSIVDCLYSFTIPNDWLEDEKVGTVSPNQIDSFEELNIMREVSLDIVPDERIEENLKENYNILDSLNCLESDFIYDTYIDEGINCIITIEKSVNEDGYDEISYGWYNGNIVMLCDEVKRKFNFAINAEKNYLRISGVVRKFQISYDLDIDKLNIKYNEYEEWLPEFLVEMVLETLNEFLHRK